MFVLVDEFHMLASYFTTPFIHIWFLFLFFSLSISMVVFVKVFVFLFPNEVSLEIKTLVQTSKNQRSKSKKWPNSKSNKQ